jgi:hypothetical protein
MSKFLSAGTYEGVADHHEKMVHVGVKMVGESTERR